MGSSTKVRTVGVSWMISTTRTVTASARVREAPQRALGRRVTTAGGMSWSSCGSRVASALLMAGLLSFGPGPATRNGPGGRHQLNKVCSVSQHLASAWRCATVDYRCASRCSSARGLEPTRPARAASPARCARAAGVRADACDARQGVATEKTGGRARRPALTRQPRRVDRSELAGLPAGSVSPIRYVSTPRAASRPSADRPHHQRLAAPHVAGANTPGTLVM